MTAVRVNVRLCGGIPRQDLPRSARAPASPPPSHRGATHTAPDRSRLAAALAQHETNTPPAALEDNIQPLGPVFDPPDWAVPAQGEARLEPVCEAIGRQQPVDLTSKPFFRIGRAPGCDVQLLHGTSSRRHALLFHHSNGACYIVDCASAHGTYVNGVRIPAPPKAGGTVIPHRIRRGALIRFGGPGAPSYVLKAFSFSLDDIHHEQQDVLQLNTRINALGKTAAEAVQDVMKRADDQSLSKKRLVEATLDEPAVKRMRCSSPPLSPEQPVRLVSPDLPPPLEKSRRRVTFSSEPPTAFYAALVTPEESLSEEDDESI